MEADILPVLNAAELRQTAVSEIARAAGAPSTRGYPTQNKSSKTVCRRSSGLLYDVFTTYDRQPVVKQAVPRSAGAATSEASRLAAALLCLRGSKALSVLTAAADAVLIPR